MVMQAGQLCLVSEHPDPSSITINDVVVPIPGERVQYAGKLQSSYKEFLHEDEVMGNVQPV
jgi:hypothetical protein